MADTHILSIQDAAGMLSKDIPTFQAEFERGSHAVGQGIFDVVGTPAPAAMLKTLKDSGVDTLDMSGRVMGTHQDRIQSIMSEGYEVMQEKGIPAPDMGQYYKAAELAHGQEGLSLDEALDTVKAQEPMSVSQGELAGVVNEEFSLLDSHSDAQFISQINSNTPHYLDDFPQAPIPGKLDCETSYKSGDLPQFEDKDTLGVELEFSKHGLFGLQGPDLYGPFKSFNSAVQSSASALESGPSGTGTVSEGITIFEGDHGYYRSEPAGQGAFSPSGLPTKAGWGSDLEAISSVVTTDIRDDFANSVGTPFIGMDVTPRNDRAPDVDLDICY